MSEIEEMVIPRVRVSLGIALMVIPVVLLVLLYGIWPDPVGASGGSDPTGYAAVLGTAWNPTLESRLMLIVLASGALGSYIHAATSFATYVGNAELHRTWVWWYILRPFVGSVLAFVLYAVTRGGLLTQSGNASVLNPFGVAAIAGMTGMFSKQAVDKLREMFDSLFRTGHGGGDAQRTGKLSAGESGPPDVGQRGGAGLTSVSGRPAAGGNPSLTAPAVGKAQGVPQEPATAAANSDQKSDPADPTKTGT